MQNRTARHLSTSLILMAMVTIMSTGFTAFAETSRYVGDGETTDFSLELSNGMATLYLARKASNMPLKEARVSLQLQGASNTIAFEESSSPGVYKLVLKSSSLDESQIIIEDGEDNDIADISPSSIGGAKSEVTASAAPPDEAKSYLWSWIFALGLGSGVGVSLIIFGVIWLWRSRQNAHLGLVALAFFGALIAQPDKSFAHGGHDHEGPSTDERTEAGAAILLHKKAQFLIGLATVKAVTEDIDDSFISYGHIIAKPQQDTFILAPQAGNLRGSQNLVLGQKVAKGQALAFIESVGRITLTSPFNGQILEILIADASRVEAGAQLFRVTDPSTVWVDAELYEADLTKFSRVSSAAIGLEGSEESYPAKLLNFMTPINENTRTAKVFLELDNSNGKLRLGSFASIHFSLASQSEGISLPLAAVVTRSGEEIVFVKTGPESFESRSVVTQKGPKPGSIIIVSGVKEGDLVVVSGSYQLLMKAR